MSVSRVGDHIPGILAADGITMTFDLSDGEGNSRMTAGNALVVVATSRRGLDEGTTMTPGWDRAKNYPTESAGLLGFDDRVRISDGTEMVLQMDWSTAGRLAAYVVELTADGAISYDKSTSDLSQVENASATSVGSGALDVATSKGFLFGVFHSEFEYGFDDGNLAATGLTILGDLASGNGSHPRVAYGIADYSTLGVKTVTWSDDTDTGGVCAGVLISFTVAGGIGKPVADAIIQSTEVDTPANITLTGTPAETATITSYTIGTGPVNGAMGGSAENVTYTPNAAFKGTDSFTYFVTDSNGLDSDEVTVTLTVGITILVRNGSTVTIDGVHNNGPDVLGNKWAEIPLPFTILEIDPPWDGTVNGAMLNPLAGPGADHGFGTNFYNENAITPALNIANQLPYEVTEASSLLCSIGNPDFVLADDLPMLAINIFSFVTSPLSDQHFAPYYCGDGGAEEFTLADVDLSFLPSDDATEISFIPSVLTYTEYLLNRYIEIDTDWEGAYFKPLDNGEAYGRDHCIQLNNIYGLLILDSLTPEQKIDVARGLIQYGLDCIGAHRNGGVWRANGGINQGRLLPMMFAAKALNNTTMIAEVTALLEIHEKDQIIPEIEQIDIDTPRSTSLNRHRDPYTQRMKGHPAWGQKHPWDRASDKANWLTSLNAPGVTSTASYNRVSGSVQVCIAMFIYRFGFQSMLNNAAFLDFYMRIYWAIEYHLRGSTNQIDNFIGSLWDNSMPSIAPCVLSDPSFDDDVTTITQSVVGGGLYLHMRNPGDPAPVGAERLNSAGSVFFSAKVGDVWEGDGGKPTWAIAYDFDTSALPAGNYDRYLTKVDITGTTELDIPYGETVNALPVGSAQSVAAVLNTTKLITVSGDDTDGDIVGSAVVETTAQGTLTKLSAFEYSYDPVLDWEGVDTFTFNLIDDQGGVSEDPSTVTITVSALAPIEANTSLLRARRLKAQPALLRRSIISRF